MRRTRTAAAALSGALLCGGLLSGCGSSRDSNSAASAPLAEPGDATVQAPAPVAAGADAAAAPAAAAPAADAAADVGAGDVAMTSGGKSANATKAAGKADPLQKGASPKNAASGSAAASPGKVGVKSAVPETALTGRDIIYTADMTVRVTDVGKAASKVESAAAAAGGIVVGSQRTSEPGVPSPESTDGKSATPPPDRSQATLTLRVPPEEFDNVLNRIGGEGEVLDRTLTGKDVTAQVVDVKSRIDSQRKSVTRIRDLMDRADTLRDIVSLESEVAQREADLDALLAKQAKLRDQSSLATITVHLLSKEAPVTAMKDPDDVGFTIGLHNGWDAFTGALAVAATVLGALLPFVVMVLVLGPPIVWFVARMRRMAAAPRPNPDGPAS